MKRAIAVALLLLESFAVAQKQPEITKAFSRKEFAERRERLRNLLGKDTAAIIRGREDLPNYVSFRENNELYYLAGTEAPDSALVIGNTESCPSV